MSIDGKLQKMTEEILSESSKNQESVVITVLVLSTGEGENNVAEDKLLYLLIFYSPF